MSKTYLITAATGIGAATARALARAEAAELPVQLMISALQRSEGELLCEELRKEGTVAECATGDLRNPQYANELVRRCIERFGNLDGLFNVAGISGRRFGDGPIHECTEDAWAITLDTNLTTQYRVCREAVRVMLGQSPGPSGQRGVILNMASILATNPEPKYFDTVAYAASKGGILAMTRSMAASYARLKIRVNAIAPSLTRTMMSAHALENQELMHFIRGKQPLTESALFPDNLACSCVYLLTDASSSVTGQTLIVDGGWSIT